MSMNLITEASAQLLRPTLGEEIEIEAMVDETVSAAMIDPAQLTTAMLNLALNARDAMPDGGKLTSRPATSSSTNTMPR